ncbi:MULTISPECIES: PucR family transcriptional regulator [unclassified Nesterenkonia]|uniref:PucR family transcriptional regulator n=1 Tax=unclassified Nesterenkonia TaxID=2629769 RepID=UPI001F4D048E|nr:MULTISPECIES: helix-turn-helix domain-containing protein [unclassified Nesterenkonia]MCH8559483.1 helix-turn-helix domain-containing protein [Nesterenkonia sp. DZ6]MCH8561660.1 helix-turn-helix domain-containing protein [Nesterenkonia sp. YGD6]
MTADEGRAEAAWDQLLAALEADGSILEETIGNIRATVPGYHDVPTSALQASVRRNIALSIRTVRAGFEPSSDDVAEADALASERHAQGVPVESVLAGFRTCMSVILHRLLDHAPDHGIPADQVLASSTLLWELGDAFSTRAVLVYRDKDVSRALADSTRRAAWIGDAVATWMEPTELARGAALYDIPTAAPLRALAAHSQPEEDLEHQRRLQDWADRAGIRVLTAVRASTLVGILIGEPPLSAEPDRLTLGLGPAVTLEGLPRSFESASTALRAAAAVGQTGVVDLERLSWRAGVHASPEVTALLQERHLQPLAEAGTFGEHVLEAVDAYLRHRLSIPLAARSIPVHANTLRYRLQRFQEMVGADLGDLDTLVELSWALAAHRGTLPHGTHS